jgi:septum site-determining protein MinD
LSTTEPTPAALGDAVRARALARELDAGLVSVVLNRGTAEAPTETIANRLGAPVTVVPEDPAVATAQAAGCPVATTAPESPAVTAFADLAAAVERAT